MKGFKRKASSRKKVTIQRTRKRGYLRTKCWQNLLRFCHTITVLIKIKIKGIEIQEMHELEKSIFSTRCCGKACSHQHFSAPYNVRSKGIEELRSVFRTEQEASQDKYQEDKHRLFSSGWAGGAREERVETQDFMEKFGFQYFAREGKEQGETSQIRKNKGMG